MISKIEKLLFHIKIQSYFGLHDSVSMFLWNTNDADNLILSKCNKGNIHHDIIQYHQMLMNKIDFDTTFEFEDKFLKSLCKYFRLWY